jgi:hypothetical protein
VCSETFCCVRLRALVTKTALGDEEIMLIIVFSRPDQHQRCVIERRRAATTVRSCDACELSFAPMTMTLTAILQNCMRILQLLLRRDMVARTPLPALRNKTDPSVRRIRWTSRCHSARFLSSSGVLFSSLGRLSNCARDGTKSNRALAVALAESVPCIAALSHSYKLKLVAQKSKYIEHIQIQPARRPPCDHQSCRLPHPAACRGARTEPQWEWRGCH